MSDAAERRPRATGALAVTLAALASLSSGCGGAASDADRHALYGALQVEEARVAAAEHAAAEGACADRPSACDEACDASAAARALADRIGERDARVRAEHAERTCAWCRAQPACDAAAGAAETRATSEVSP